MDKGVFLRDLENALEGEVSRSVINDTINYYNRYISDEVNAGKTEEEVLKGLGSGNVIAKTVIASEQAKSGEGGFSYDSSDSSSYGNQYSDSYAGKEKGLHMSMDSDGNMDIQYGSFKLNSWYGKLLGLLLVILVITLIFMIIAGLFSLIWALLPVFIIGFLLITLINYFWGR